MFSLRYCVLANSIGLNWAQGRNACVDFLEFPPLLTHFNTAALRAQYFWAKVQDVIFISCFTCFHVQELLQAVVNAGVKQGEQFQINMELPRFWIFSSTFAKLKGCYH